MYNFLDNESTKEYFEIIHNAQARSIPEIYESHHIIPVSFKTENNDVVAVTIEEHLKLHRLLIDMTEGEHKSKMCFAYHRMKYGRQGWLVGMTAEEKKDKFEEYIKGRRPRNV